MSAQPARANTAANTATATPTLSVHSAPIAPRWRNVLILIGCASLLFALGCAKTRAQKEQDDKFFTSGSQEADRRADTRVPNEEGEGGPSPAQGSSAASASATGAKTNQEQKNATLYDRLGGEEGIRKIVDDFIQRALEDPRVNWARKGVTTGGFFERDKSVEWNPTPQNVQRLKQRFVQFITLAAGGPANYTGRPIKAVHDEMQITEPEFEATIGDLKATLDKLQVTPEIQKELLSLFESTRPQIVIKK